MASPAASSGWNGPGRKLVASLALVLLGAFALSAGLGYLLAQQSDDRHQQQQRAALLGAIEEFRTVFADYTLRRAADIGAVSWIAGPLSASDIAIKLAPAGLAPYRFERAYLVSADDHVIASFPAGEASIPLSVVRLVAKFRDEHGERIKATMNVPDLLGSEIAPVASDVIVVDERPALAAVAFVRMAPNSGFDRGVPLIAVAKLDSLRIGVFERSSGVTSLDFSIDPPEHDREMQSLLDRQGRIVGWFSWETQRPMRDALARLSPLLAAVAAFLAGFAALAVRQVGRATRRLAASEAQAQRMAHEDPLTGLPNRRRMFEVLDSALAERKPDQSVTFAFLDLDGFKEVNELLGHQGGDQLLAAAAGRLQATIPDAATIGRLGGDEFGMVMTDADQNSALQAAHAAAQALTRPFWIASQAVQISLSIGLAQAPGDGESRDDLARRADLALRSVKRHGRGRAARFEPGLEREFHDHLFMKRDLKRALAENSLDVHYQPIVAADGLRIVGVEALLRWKHPMRGDIPPADFVAVAEQTGMMGELGAFVLRRALADALRWKDIYIAVNLSPVQVRDRALVGLIARALQETGIAPSRVMLEVTEGVLIENPDDAKERLNQLRALGVKIALDDFGSGYSSLSYLRRFPIDKLKIDKEFVAPLGRSADSGVIIQAIMALGRALGLTVLCEGVETEEQRVLLRLAGCDEMQGYLFARPAPRAAIDELIASRARRREPDSLAAAAL